MRRFLLLVTLLAAGLALAQTARSISVVQSGTYRAVGDGGIRPTTLDFAASAARALDIGGACGLQVSVCGPTLTTLTGGTVKAWWLPASGTDPMSNVDLDLTVGTPLAACRVFADQRVAVGLGGKVLYVTSAMTGTDVDAGSLTVDGGRFTVTTTARLCP